MPLSSSCSKERRLHLRSHWSLPHRWLEMAGVGSVGLSRGPYRTVHLPFVRPFSLSLSLSHTHTHTHTHTHAHTRTHRYCPPVRSYLSSFLVPVTFLALSGVSSLSLELSSPCAGNREGEESDPLTGVHTRDYTQRAQHTQKRAGVSGSPGRGRQLQNHIPSRSSVPSSPSFTP